MKHRWSIRPLLLILSLIALGGCSTFKPEALNYQKLELSNKESPLDYAVYTPPNWQQGEQLPIVLFLHGGGGSHLSFEQYMADEFLDKEINAGRIPRFILVSPNGNNGFWMNWADGSYHYQDWVLNDVFPKVASDYGALECPKHCYLAGISMGGFGVLRFAHLARDTFSAVSSISAPIFSRDQAKQQKTSWLIRLLFPFDRIFSLENSQMAETDPYQVWSKASASIAPRLQLIYGDKDRESIINGNRQLHEHLMRNKIEHDYYVYEGGHKWKYWVPNLDKVFNFLLQNGNE